MIALAVHMRASRKRVAIYTVRLVDDKEKPVKSGGQEIVGVADSNEVLEAGINGIYGKQANLTFLFVQKGTIDVNYSHFAAAPTYPLNTNGKATSVDPNTGDNVYSEPWEIPFQSIADNSGADYTLFYVSDLKDDSSGQLLGEANRIAGTLAVIASIKPKVPEEVKVVRRVLTVAHELGHLLGLYHPWGTPTETLDLTKNGANLWKFPNPNTTRLMDYHNDAALLTREEWKIVNPR